MHARARHVARRGRAQKHYDIRGFRGFTEAAERYAFGFFRVVLVGADARLREAALMLAGAWRYHKKSPLAPIFAASGTGLRSSVVEEAHARFGIPIRVFRPGLVVVSGWHPNVTDVHDTSAVAEQNKQLTAVLERRLARSTRGRPGLEARTVAAPGGLLNYLSRHAREVQLVVVGRGRAHGVAEMTGPPSYLALHDTDCSVLVCDPHSPL